MTLRFHHAATDELVAAVEYYEEHSEGLGRDFLNEVRTATAMLLENPEIGFSIGSDLRRVVLRRFPFNVIYACEGADLFILAIAHHRRRPDYWTDRLDP